MDIIKFHVKNNYYVSVKPLPGMYGCIALFPENKLKNVPRLSKTYILCNKTYGIEYYINWGDTYKTDNIQACSVNIRILVAQDILLTTVRWGISSKLILSQEKTLFGILELPQTDEEKKKETQLCVEYRKLLTGKVPNDDIEGYDQLLSYFEKGGFLL